MKVTEDAEPGKPRQIQAFELRMNIIADATIDLLFTKNRVTPLSLHLSFSISSMPRHVPAVDIGLCFMLSQMFIPGQCLAFHQAECVKCILNISTNAC